jgi:hypothetical protein
LDLLRVAITPKEESAWLEEELHLTLTGDTSIVWAVDTESLSTSLLGKKRSEFSGILSGVPSIDEAKVRFRPSWWKGRFPDDPDRLVIRVGEGGE